MVVIHVAAPPPAPGSRGGTNVIVHEAGNVGGTPPVLIYQQENFIRVMDEVRSANPELARLADGDGTGNFSYAQIDADDELRDLVSARTQADFDKLSQFEREVFRQKSEDAKKDVWRIYRAQNRLIENDESLAQKAEDDRLIAIGLVPGTIAAREAMMQSKNKNDEREQGAKAASTDILLVPPFCGSGSKKCKILALIDNKDEEYF